MHDRLGLEPASTFTVASTSSHYHLPRNTRKLTMLLEHEIVEAIQKLSRQLDYSCKDCPAAEHSDLLRSVIEDLKLQLDELVRRRPVYLK